MVSSGACTSPTRSQCSSKRHKKKGSQEQLTSRKATRRLGWRARMPPPQKLAAANICSTGCEKVWLSMALSPNCSPTCGKADVSPSWKPIDIIGDSVYLLYAHLSDLTRQT